MGLPQFLHDPAEGQFTVGGADRSKVGMEFGGKAFEVSIVSKDPVPAPQLSYKRMAILKTYQALGGFANMSDDIAAFDGVITNELGDW